MGWGQGRKKEEEEEEKRKQSHPAIGLDFDARTHPYASVWAYPDLVGKKKKRMMDEETVSIVDTIVKQETNAYVGTWSVLAAKWRITLTKPIWCRHPGATVSPAIRILITIPGPKKGYTECSLKCLTSGIKIAAKRRLMYSIKRDEPPGKGRSWIRCRLSLRCSLMQLHHDRGSNAAHGRSMALPSSNQLRSLLAIHNSSTSPVWRGAVLRC